MVADAREIWRLGPGRAALRRTSAPLISIWPLIGLLGVNHLSLTRLEIGARWSSERSRHPDGHGTGADRSGLI
ncbi:MAG: hypothetical protein ACRDIC_19820, partial [bacterium]